MQHVFKLIMTGFCTLAVSLATATAEDSPQSIDEAYTRLTKLFGAPQDPARLTRFVLDETIVTQPKKDGPKIVVVNKGQQVLTNPVVHGDSIVWTENEILIRDVFNEYEDGTRKLNRHVERTNSREVRITMFPGDLWVVEQRLNSHSLPRFQNLTVGRGTVKWLEDGLECCTAGFDTMYDTDGSVQPKAYVSIERFTTDGKKLVVEYDFRNYEMASDPKGNKLLVPDFDRTWGDPVNLKRVSEPRSE